MRRSVLFAVFTAALAGLNTARAQLPSLIVDPERQPDAVIELWPDGAPGGEGVDLTEVRAERSNSYGLADHSVTDIVAPVLWVFRASEPDGSAVLIAPGGGYSLIVVEHEGWETARWFARRGTTAYVMTYRLPQQGWAAESDTPLQDAQRAMRVVRSRAEADGFDPDRIMMLGFSAGGHVAGSLAMRFAASVYQPVDAVDNLSARPDAAVLVYPVATMQEPAVHMGSRQNLIGANPSAETISRYSLEESVPADAPPTVLIHAADDRAVPPENSISLFEALNEAGIPAALHIFDSGGHGFGVRIADDQPRAAWPELVVDFARANGVIGQSR